LQFAGFNQVPQIDLFGNVIDRCYEKLGLILFITLKESADVNPDHMTIPVDIPFLPSMGLFVTTNEGAYNLLAGLNVLGMGYFRPIPLNHLIIRITDQVPECFVGPDDAIGFGNGHSNGRIFEKS
jgi:hypothetical protein